MMDSKQETVRVEMLGGFSVRVGSRTIGHNEWRLRKAAALTKLLALAPDHRLHREQDGGALAAPRKPCRLKQPAQDPSRRPKSPRPCRKLSLPGIRARAARSPRAVPDPLTGREQEVASLLGQGLSNRRIASELDLSEHTVHHHVTSILNKLNLSSRQQVASRLRDR